jgi:hypothetical protein
MAQHITAAYLSVALRLQEAAGADTLSSNDIRARLADAIQDAHRGTGKWGYYVDHFGDAESGDVIYSCDGDTMSAPYSITSAGGASKCIIDMESATDVVPRTIYEPEADEDEHYAAMEESFQRNGLYTGLPLYERFISKSEREKADASDFAGKGKSFPILKPEDVQAAAHALGRAGDKNMGPSGIKARIIGIAKRKGWEKYLPKAWQGSGTDTSEAASGAASGELSLTESAATVDIIRLQEARSDYEIKLIAPGKGSSAYYTPEVLRRDGPSVFAAGTHVYLNHPTAAEESARPEGDIRNLAGVLTTAAEYRESHPKGEGLYARMKVFADHAQTVEEKAPHVGMSIRASGIAESGKMRDGVPVLKALTHAESVDVVTRAGAGGMILTESARAGSASLKEADEMTAEEAKKLIDTAVAEATRPLRERAIQGDARAEAARLLESATLPHVAKQRIIERAVVTLPRDAAGELDTAKFREAVVAEAKAEGEYLAQVTGSGRVFGMGAGAPIAIDAKEAERQAAADRASEADAVSIFESLGMPKDAAQLAAKGRAA